jgi:hypothetical protein
MIVMEIINMARYKFLALSVCFLFTLSAVQAQSDLPSEKIEVVKNFDARLIEAQKLHIRPKPLEIDTTSRHYNYTVSVDVPEVEYIEPTIKPIGLKAAPRPKYYRGFARAGYGIPSAILGDLSYQIAQSDEFQMGVGLHHNSANNKDIANQRYMDNDGGLNATWYASPAMAVSGDLNYSFDDYYYYAEDPNHPRPDFDKRRYKTFDGAAGISNTERIKGDLNYKATFRFINIQDDQGAKENNMLLSLRGDKRIAGRHVLALDLDGDFSTLNDIEKRKLNNYFIRPTFLFKGNTWSAKVGVNIASDTKDFYFYPIVDASVKILGTKLIAFVGADGTLKKNNFYTLSTYNPYISERIDEIKNTRQSTYFGGAKGRFGFIEYQLTYTYATTKDLALFLPERADQRTFQPIYDDVNISTIDGQIRVKPFDQLEVGLSIAKMIYSTTYEEEAWLLPGLEGRLFASYLMLKDRLRVRGDFFVLNGVHYIKDDKSTDVLNGIYDLSFSADWFFSEKFGVFVKANNVLANKGERWQRYPSFGFNAVGGVLVRF